MPFRPFENDERGASPLPLLLISYGFFFDGLIAIGRFGAGPAGAVTQDRYTMPNLVMLAGIVLYACAHIPSLHRQDELNNRFKWFEIVGFMTLMIFVFAQCLATVNFGLVNGRKTHEAHETAARVTVNLNAIPTEQEQGCAAAFAAIPPESPSGALYYLYLYSNEMSAENWSVFQPATLRVYRAKGPPSHQAIVAAGDAAAVKDLWAAECP